METHNVLITGPSRTGKTSLCLMWSGCVRPQSYITTLSVERHTCRVHSEYQLTLYDMPGLTRFFVNLERFYARSDVIVLVVHIDNPSDSMYARIAPWAPLASWLLVVTASEPCPKWRAWALSRSIAVCSVSLTSPTSVAECLDNVLTLCQHHASRHSVAFGSDEPRPLSCV